MKKIILLFLFVLSATAYSQERFSSNEYNFAITFPKGWDIDRNSKSYVVETSDNSYVGVSISALKNPRLPDSMDIGYIAKDSLQKIIEEQMINRYGRAKVLYSGNGLMDGVLAYFYFVQYSDKKDGYPTKFVSFQYQFLYKTIFYSIFAVCPANRYEDYEKTFNDIYKTFRFIKKL